MQLDPGHLAPKGAPVRGASRGRGDHLIHEPGRGNLGTSVGWQEAWEPVLR